MPTLSRVSRSRSSAPELKLSGQPIELAHRRRRQIAVPVHLPLPHNASQQQVARQAVGQGGAWMAALPGTPQFGAWHPGQRHDLSVKVGRVHGRSPGAPGASRLVPRPHARQTRAPSAQQRDSREHLCSVFNDRRAKSGRANVRDGLCTSPRRGRLTIPFESRIWPRITPRRAVPPDARAGTLQVRNNVRRSSPRLA